MSILTFKKDNHAECASSTLKLAPSRGNVVYTSNKSIYQDISILRLLDNTSFPVHLVRSNVNKRTYAMKAFPHEDSQPHLYFVNESRFGCLQHQNILRCLHFEKKREADFDGISKNVSYTIMEHAPNGDLFNFIRSHYSKIDDTLVRTYFRQLIEGLEYLHKNEVAHLDIKLDNLLLSADYTLKLSDFSRAHFAEDAIIISNGTCLYRAPEMQLGQCVNPKAADIYSAGVILFILKTKGVFPYMEGDMDEGVDFGELLKRSANKFWEMHSKIQGRKREFFDKDFCDLFVGMTKHDADRRLTIEKIKQSNWYNGPVYDAEELKVRF